MRDPVRQWVAHVVEHERPQAPVLEVGSLDVNGTIRDLFPEPYTGLDLEMGPGVDVVGDIETVRLRETYETIVCCETLEHVKHPWEALDSMAQLIAEGGLLIITVPYAFPIHGYPSDYWRFTPNGLDLLISDAGFTVVRIDMEGSVPDIGPSGVFAVARMP